MAWSFNSAIADLVWYDTIDSIILDETILDLGVGDLLLDTGNRSNDGSTLDQGLRVIDGNI